MRVLVKILAALGVVFLGLVAVVAFLFRESSDFREEHELFIEQFLHSYSEHWEVADVHSHVATEFLESLSTPEGRQAIAIFRRLGRLRSISDLKIGNFFAGTSGKRGDFSFKATFANSPALVKLTLQEKDGSPRVLGLHITPSSDLQPLEPAEAEI